MNDVDALRIRIAAVEEVLAMARVGTVSRERIFEHLRGLRAELAAHPVVVAVEWWRSLTAKADAAKAARFAAPPVGGGPYHCKSCAYGTELPNEECLACSCM